MTSDPLCQSQLLVQAAKLKQTKTHKIRACKPSNPFDETRLNTVYITKQHSPQKDIKAGAAPENQRLKRPNETILATWIIRLTHTHLKKLLDDVISKDVHHQLVGRLQDLTEDELALC